MESNKRDWILRIILLVCAVAFAGFADYSYWKRSSKIEPKICEEVDSSETTEKEEEDIPEPVINEITVSLAGDCSIGKLSVHDYDGSFYNYFDDNGAEYFFKNVKEYFANDSMTLVNFEGVLTDSDAIVKKQYNIKGRPDFISVLPLGSIEAVSFGNNHRADYGQESTNDTVALFEENNITWAYDKNYGIYETPEGIKIGYVSVNEVYDGETVETYLKDGIDYLKAQNVNLIFCCIHWGIEGEHYPTEYQKSLARQCIDWGADLIIGSHPHVLQGFDYYNGKYIIYSLGNFCFGGNSNPKDKNSMIVQIKFNFTDGVLSEEPIVKAIPCSISSISSRNDFCPTPANEERYSHIIDLLNEYSFAFSVSIDQDGYLSHN